MEEHKDLLKKEAGEKAAEFIEEGMVVGLGSGSTVYWMLKKLGELVEQGLNIKGIPTSSQTEEWAKEFKIPLTDFSAVRHIDVAIDGADEMDPVFNMIKGGGGALVREKIVAAYAKKFIIVADESKVVDELGTFPLPVEVLRFGWQMTAEKIAELGVKPVLREKDGNAFISDNGNYILDCAFGSIPDPGRLHQNLKQLLGVVETGLFTGMADMVVLAGADGVKVINKVEVQNGKKMIDSDLGE